MLPLFAVLFGFCSLASGAIYDSIDVIPNLDWDFIIVGGGTAGSVLANRLTENRKFNVLVIEAGPTNDGVIDSIVPGLEFGTARSSVDWNFTTTPQRGLNGRSFNYQRGHTLGGSSSVNAMFYTRGSASDFNRFAAVTGDPGWSWNRLQSYFKKSEKFEDPVDNHDIRGQFNPGVHGFSGKVGVTLPGFLHPPVDSATLQAAKELGSDFKFNADMNSGTPLGIGWLQSTIGHDGTRSSAATSYLDEGTQMRENLHIVTNTRVTRVLRTAGAQAQGLTIRTIEIRSPSSPETVLLTAAKEVILSAGSINTPHILLHSGIGDESDLRNLGIQTVLHNPSVGRNLSDHPFFGTTFGLVPDSIDLGPWADVGVDRTLQDEALQLWNLNRTGPLVALLSSDHVAWIRLPGNSSIFEEFSDPSSGPDSPHIEFVLGSSAGTYGIGVNIVSPVSRGSLTIRSNNPFDDPLIDLGIFNSDLDLFVAREAVKLALNFAQTPFWNNIIAGIEGPFVGANNDAEIENVLRNITASALHGVSTAAMSPRNASWGVVDPDLLVKRLSGLRIVDASVMPFVPCAHTQTPVYAIAERAADMIKQVWD